MSILKPNYPDIKMCDAIEPHVAIFTDGGCRNNQKKKNIGGYGIVVVTPDKKEPYETMIGYAYNTTNNRMELEAVVHALTKVPEIFDSDILKNDVVVYTDSNYVAQAANAWVFNWKRNNWRTANDTDVRNQDLWMLYLDALRGLNDVIVIHVPRSSHPLNIMADKLANDAMDIAEEMGPPRKEEKDA